MDVNTAKAGAALSDTDLMKLLAGNKDAIAALVARATQDSGPASALEAPSDVSLAAKHAAAIREALSPVLLALDAAKADGYENVFSIGAGEGGKSAIGHFKMTKTYAV